MDADLKDRETPDSGRARARTWRFAVGADRGGGKGRGEDRGEDRWEDRWDDLAREEPLEVRLVREGRRRTVAVTMRTPGADAELAAGFLFAEGVVEGREQILRAGHCRDEEAGGSAGCSNIVEVELAPGVPEPELARLERHFFATSACGVCGRAGLEALRVGVRGSLSPGPRLSPEVLLALPERLREAQGLFAATGGLHAAALFDAAGELLAVREDVGRHNALDKLVGWALFEGRLPLDDHLVLVSGRSSWEILQKCLVAGVPVVCAVSAPSSLAVELAESFGVTLIGFLRDGRFNVYSGPGRISEASARGGGRRASLPLAPSST
jgi:FdhD protein